MIDNSENVVFQNDKYVATLWQGSLYMYYADSYAKGMTERAGKIINGMRGLETTCGGKFENWIKKIEARDRKTMVSYMDQAAQLERQARSIARRHNFPEPQLDREYPREVQLLIGEIIERRNATPDVKVKTLYHDLLNYWDSKRPMRLVFS